MSDRMILELPTPAEVQRKRVIQELGLLYRERPREEEFMARAYQILQLHDRGLVEMANSFYRQACEAVKVDPPNFIIDPKDFA